MTQVSRRPMPKDLETQMHNLFRHAISILQNEKDVAEFLEDLLTPTEKIMLAKRLAIAILLERGFDHRTIHNIMRVSLTTVSTVHYWLKQKGNGYRKIIGVIVTEKKTGEWLDKFNSIIEGLFTWNKSMYPKPPQEIYPRDTIV